MGDAADFSIECEENRALYPYGIDIMFSDPVRDGNRRILAEHVWTTASGDEIKFKDMALSQLLNVVRMQERKKHKFAPQLRDYYQYRVTLSSSSEYLGIA